MRVCKLIGIRLSMPLGQSGRVLACDGIIFYTGLRDDPEVWDECFGDGVMSVT